MSTDDEDFFPSDPAQRDMEELQWRANFEAMVMSGHFAVQRGGIRHRMVDDHGTEEGDNG